ncbi:MAG: sensor histidine kinase [Prevotella sp.]|nr:sensor histidine kinase [Prevotella sp.]
MKQRRMIMTAALLMSLSAAMAYTDHRNAKVDSAEQVLNSKQPLSDKERMGCYYIIVRGTLGKDSKKHDYYCHQMLDLSYKIDAKNMRENALNHLGLQHYGQDDYEPAERYFIWALAVTDSMKGDSRYTESDVDDNLSQLYGSLGNLYNVQDKSLLAIEYYQKALPIFEKHGWLESQTILHHNVAELYLPMGNTEKAEAHYLRAMETGQQSGDSLMMALPRKGLVKIYIDTGDYEKAREIIEPAYAYYRAHRDEETDDYPEVLASLVKLHLMSGHEDLRKAKAYAEEALTYAEGEMMSETRFDVFAAATMIEMKEGNWQKALEYGLKSVHENDDEVTYSDVGCFEMLAQIYMELGNKAEASKYIKKVRATMEQFATSHYQSGLSQMEVLYETKKKEAEIAQLTREKQWYLWGGILTALVLLLTAITFCLLWLGIRLRRRTALVQARLDGEIAERVRIARDLHDRLGGTLTAIKQNITPADSSSKGENVVLLVDEAIREMRNVSHHLLPDSLSRYGLRTALRDFCQTLRGVSFSFTGEERHIAHEEALYCIVYELVNNAVKSSGAEHIHVQLMVDEGLSVVNVRDDGNGLQPQSASEGSGLNNIQERVKALGGRMDLYSEAGKGTEINIEIGEDSKNPQLGG